MSYTFVAPRMQIFPFPPDIMNRLWKKPSSFKVALKLYQTCKYFYYKQNAVFFNRICCYKGNLQTPNSLKTLNLKDSVLCFTNELIITSLFWGKKPVMSRFRNIHCLKMGQTKLKFEDFEILTLNNCISKFKLNESFLTYPDGSAVTIDAVLEKLPNVKYFEYYNRHDFYSAGTLENLNTIKLCHKLQLFDIRIGKISKTFNPLLLCKFIENNVHHSGRIHITGLFTDEVKGKSLVQEIKKVWDSWEDREDEISILGFSGTLCKFF